jgi:hypothetical protein
LLFVFCRPFLAVHGRPSKTSSTVEAFERLSDR